MAESPNMFSSPLAKTTAEEPSPLTDYKSPEVKPGDLEYRLLETPHSEGFGELDEPQIEEELIALVPLGTDAYEFTVETAVATYVQEGHGEAAEAKAPGEKRIVILCDDHAEMLPSEIDVDEHITVNMINAAEPGQGNYLKDDGATDFVDLYDELKDVVPEEVLLEQLQRLGRKKKDPFLELLKKKGQEDFVDAGFTRFPGWGISYNVRKMPELAFQRDRMIKYGLYVLDVSPAAGGGRFSIGN